MFYMHGGGISFETRIPDRYARRFRLPLNIVRMYTHTRFREKPSSLLSIFLQLVLPRVENKIRGGIRYDTSEIPRGERVSIFARGEDHQSSIITNHS